jgi:hypothetical protein
MILTINSQENPESNSIASALANRRADAGRNVLLLCQKKTKKRVMPDSKAAGEETWLATEMKAGAKPRELARNEIANELAAADHLYRDIVIDLPKLQHADSLYVLAASALAVFAIQVDSWDLECQKTLIQRIRAARLWNATLPVLVVVDEPASQAGQDIVSQLANSVSGLRTIESTQTSHMSIAALYQEIYPS